jgi:acetylornithine deacetylase
MYAEVTPRSMNLSSSIPESHGLVQAGIALDARPYASTLSDQSVLSCKSLKLALIRCGRTQQMNLYM